MKRYIKSSHTLDELSKMSDKDCLKAICEELKAHGIDTTMHNYELGAETYQRFSSGPMYNVKFRCPGDYLAYFAMIAHQEAATLSGLVDAIYTTIEMYDGFDGFFEEFGTTVKSMYDHAFESWWGDGDDYIVYLKNLDTGETLYSGGDGGYESYETEDSDWDGWDE